MTTQGGREQECVVESLGISAALLLQNAALALGADGSPSAASKNKGALSLLAAAAVGSGDADDSSLFVLDDADCSHDHIGGSSALAASDEEALAALATELAALSQPLAAAASLAAAQPEQHLSLARSLRRAEGDRLRILKVLSGY